MVSADEDGNIVVWQCDEKTRQITEIRGSGLVKISDNIRQLISKRIKAEHLERNTLGKNEYLLASGSSTFSEHRA